MEKQSREKMMPGPPPPKPDPCYPPFKTSYKLTFYYRPGEKVTVRGIDFTGIVNGMSISSSLEVQYWVFNGKEERCFPESFLMPEYPYLGELPPGPPPPGYESEYPMSGDGVASSLS